MSDQRIIDAVCAEVPDCGAVPLTAALVDVAQTALVFLDANPDLNGTGPLWGSADVYRAILTDLGIGEAS